VWFFDEDTARKHGFRHWKEGRKAADGSGIAALADVPAGKFGAGSATPGAGGSGPQGWTIKGNEDSMLFHTPESPSYKRTIAEVWFFDEDTARKAGFTHWKEGRKGAGAAKLVADVPPGPFGPGSAKPAADGSGPEGWTVKGNEDSMLYHSTESPSYAVTIAEVWFRDVATAEAAGFNRWDSGKSQRGK
jgi:allophanate hydrolase subunit 1